MARRLLIAEVSEERVRDSQRLGYNGWREGPLGQQRDYSES